MKSSLFFNLRRRAAHSTSGPGFTDNPAAPSSGGSGFASFLVGLSDGASINNLHNIDYHHQVYAFYGQDDWRVTPKLTLNLGLRYELFTTIKEKNNEMGTFDLSTGSLIVPKGVTAQLTPMLAAIVPVEATGTPGLISPDTNNFAPRIGLAYQATQQAGGAGRIRNFLRRGRGRAIFQSEHGIQSPILYQQEFQPALRRRVRQSRGSGLFPGRHTYACQRISREFTDRSRASPTFLFTRSPIWSRLTCSSGTFPRSMNFPRTRCLNSLTQDRAD